ncbi:hypothetical protein [Burkholderia territorii]|uniref:hypothetical protein n=1 Tax=Burkholderia territorii TaxID=1503055 RepID=UPI000A97D6E4|nr:hypothetical protein [Burkholderia territorii]
MTLPASFPMSMSQIASELGLALPLSINHAWVVALAGKSGLPVSFSDLLGQSGRIDGSYLAQVGGGGLSVGITTNAPFFGATVGGFSFGGHVGSTAYSVSVSAGCHWNGNLLVKNNTIGQSIVLPWIGSGWGMPSSDGSLLRQGQTDNFTITPSN